MPCRRTASSAYWEQVGWKRQFGPSSGLTNHRYRLIMGDSTGLMHQSTRARARHERDLREDRAASGNPVSPRRRGRPPRHVPGFLFCDRASRIPGQDKVEEGCSSFDGGRR